MLDRGGTETFPVYIANSRTILLIRINAMRDSSTTILPQNAMLALEMNATLFSTITNCLNAIVES